MTRVLLFAIVGALVVAIVVAVTVAGRPRRQAEADPAPTRVIREAATRSYNRYLATQDPTTTTSTTVVTTTTRPPPEPPPTAVTEPRRPLPSSGGGWQALVAEYPWPTTTADRVVMCESGGNANAYNASSGATGLFQVLHGPWDPAANVADAYRMWRDRGWEPWTASRACWA